MGTSMKLNIKAYAKINLFLKVYDTLPNGYHDLFMLMSRVSLYDEMEVDITPNDEYSISLHGSPCSRIEDDLIYKSCARFIEEYKATPSAIPFKIDIKLNKNIPSEAGLGGGSSDAGAILSELNKIYKTLADDELMALGASLGADIPFFIKGESSFIRGIGEKVIPIPTLAGLPILILKPYEGVSTGACFSKCHSSITEAECILFESSMRVFEDSSITPINRIRKAKKHLINDLEKPAVSLCPGVASALKALESTSPLYSSMSGSGSACFAIYDKAELRDNAYSLLSESLEATSIYRAQII